MQIHPSIRSAATLVAFSLVLARCDSLESPLGEENRFVVESYHQVGQPLGNVRFTRAADIDGIYLPDDRAISGADVRIYLIAPDGSQEKEFLYRESGDEPGVYEPLAPEPVLEAREYELEITHPEAAGTIRASTFTPESFEIVRPALDEVVYQQQPQFEFGVTRSNFPGRQSIFVFSVESLNPKIEALTPIYFDIIDPLDDDMADLTEEQILQDYVVFESPPIFEGNYEVLPDNTINIKLPWFAIVFFGPNKIHASALDENLYDFLRSVQIQQGGSTLAPGEIPNVINRIEGATGIFGMYSRVSQDTNVLRE